MQYLRKVAHSLEEMHKFLKGLMMLNAGQKRLEAHGTWLKFNTPIAADGLQIASIEANSSVRARMEGEVVKLRPHPDSKVVITCEVPEN